MTNTIRFLDQRDIADLSSYLTRARKLDDDGCVKFRAFGDILAVYVSPIFSGSLMGDGPTVLGLRTMKIEKAELDATFTIASIQERLASPAVEGMQLELPQESTRAAWSGVTPPRQDWEESGTVSQAQISQWAKDGIAEVANTLPSSVGSSIAARVRLGIWGKTVSLEFHLPGAAAFAMAGLGFMQKDEEIKVYTAKGWVRLSSAHGHVLSKQSFKIA
ncbi:MAG: hypothetical protein DCO81_02735 [Candidatus Aquiluna sp. XM-24bin5]|nr:MAG: hypothetical protein DCO81_02735 [Candidatus Aquiluna sp. XM-24bin5]